MQVILPLHVANGKNKFTNGLRAAAAQVTKRSAESRAPHRAALTRDIQLNSGMIAIAGAVRLIRLVESANRD